jgi:hypothetical protein
MSFLLSERRVAAPADSESQFTDRSPAASRDQRILRRFVPSCARGPADHDRSCFREAATTIPKRSSYALRYVLQIRASDLVEVRRKHHPTEDSPKEVADAIVEHLTS